jgi:hypothetical protein
MIHDRVVDILNFSETVFYVSKTLQVDGEMFKNVRNVLLCKFSGFRDGSYCECICNCCDLSARITAVLHIFSLNTNVGNQS